MDYFQVFQAVKITHNSKNLHLFYPYLGNNLRILNLSHSQLRSTSFLREINTDSLEFIKKAAIKDLEIEKRDANLAKQRIGLAATGGGLILLILLAVSVSSDFP